MYSYFCQSVHYHESQALVSKPSPLSADAPALTDAAPDEADRECMIYSARACRGTPSLLPAKDSAESWDGVRASMSL